MTKDADRPDFGSAAASSKSAMTTDARDGGGHDVFVRRRLAGGADMAATSTGSLCKLEPKQLRRPSMRTRTRTRMKTRPRIDSFRFSMILTDFHRFS